MASEYTPNRRYPLYTDNDKPNLRDQYNGAIREIDTDMAKALSDSSTVAAALGAGFDAQHTVRMALDEKATSSALTTEVSNREATDTALGTRIDNETSARQSADTALGTRIDNETSARQSADTALGTRIDNEVSARQSADTALGTRINNEVSARQSADTALSARIDGLNRKGIILIGDSYGQGYTPDGNVEGWTNRAKTHLTRLGYDVAIGNLGGGGFSRETAYNFNTTLTTVIGTLTAEQKLEVGLVFVGGGFNDRNASQTDINNGMQTFANTVKNNLPNAKVLVAFFGSCVTGLTSGSHAGATLKQCEQGYQKYTAGSAQCGFGSVRGAIGWLWNNDWFSSDYVHPNNSGEYTLAYNVANICSGGTGLYQNNTSLVTAGIIPAQGVTFQVETKIYFHQGPDGQPEGLHIGNFGSDVIIELNQPVQNTQFKVGSIKSAGFTSYRMTFIVTAQVNIEVTNGGTKYMFVPLYVNIDDKGDIYFKLRSITADHSNYYQGNIVAIAIVGGGTGTYM